MCTHDAPSPDQRYTRGPSEATAKVPVGLDVVATEDAVLLPPSSKESLLADPTGDQLRERTGAACWRMDASSIRRASHTQTRLGNVSLLVARKHPSADQARRPVQPITPSHILSQILRSRYVQQTTEAGLLLLCLDESFKHT